MSHWVWKVWTHKTRHLFEATPIKSIGFFNVAAEGWDSDNSWAIVFIEDKDAALFNPANYRRKVPGKAPNRV